MQGKARSKIITLQKQVGKEIAITRSRIQFIS